MEVFGIGPGEVRLHVPVASITTDLPRIVAQLVRVAVPVQSLHTVRARGTESVEVVVRDRDEDRARALLFHMPLGVEPERLPAASTEG